MPTKPRNRQGLTENGAGQIACPVCHEHRCKLVFVSYGSPFATVVTSVTQTKINYSIEGEGEHQYLSILFQCRSGHTFAVDMDYVEDEAESTVGVTTFVTKWEEGEG